MDPEKSIFPALAESVVPVDSVSAGTSLVVANVAFSQERMARVRRAIISISQKPVTDSQLEVCAFVIDTLIMLTGAPLGELVDVSAER